MSSLSVPSWRSRSPLQAVTVYSFSTVLLCIVKIEIEQIKLQQYFHAKQKEPLALILSLVV